MCPVLATLGPWSLAVLPALFAVLAGLMVIWVWQEGRHGGFRGLTPPRVLAALGAAALLAVMFFFLIKRFGPIEIKAYGTMLIVAFAAGAFYIIRWGNRAVLQPADVVDMALYCLIGAVLGSRIIFVALDWHTYASQPTHILNVWEGGLSFHGGLLGALVATGLFAWRRGKQYLRLLDEAAPGIALGYAFARVGCFLNGCCHGHPTNLPWGMIFPHGEIKDVPVHPTQLYSIVATLLILAALVLLKRWLLRPGQIFASYLSLYSVSRFVMELTRAGATGKYLGGGHGLTVGQFASILIFLLGLIYVVVSQARARVSKPEA